MHRHGYKGRKFHRERDQRQALVKGLADSLVKYESIETTVPKAKEVLPYVEKLITKAKQGGLHNRRQIITKLQTVSSAHKLVDEIAPQLQSRNSGHLRLVKTGFRRGDRSAMARISFVDSLKQPIGAQPAVVPTTPKIEASPAAAKPRTKKVEPK